MPALKRVAGLLLLLATGHAGAAALGSLSVETRDTPDAKTFVVEGSLDVDLGVSRAYAAATRFEALAAAAELIESSRLVGPDRLDSRLSMCVAFYCKTVRQVANLSRMPPTELDMAFVPGAGDFKTGRAHWRFMPAGPGHTHIVFDATLVPDFWVPPLIGSWAIRRALAGQVLDTGRAIEQVAAGLSDEAVAQAAMRPNARRRNPESVSSP
ncbi:hypothetical protein [Salinisphaera japonica]|uniref:Ribosome association toxin RatA n=1 Tax=Salinisphaera japonica YTM-1 TaxID=1209778 RepID=A0A423PWZ4_9GAMM|nr:hypothetical protein [Salinisphaera japonica]ROO30126.1 hypothetical protein SAJA_05215 [Salinisphaera japonica YTM-1]